MLDAKKKKEPANPEWRVGMKPVHSQRAGERMGGSLQRWLDDEVSNTHQCRIDRLRRLLIQVHCEGRAWAELCFEAGGRETKRPRQNARAMGDTALLA